MVKDKVRKTIDRHKLFQPGDKVLTGVSGGPPDSLCLLHILLQLRSELGIRIYVAHLDHGLRAEASREFEFVRALSGKWACLLRCQGRYRFYRQKKGLSVQAAARFCRYIFFKRRLLILAPTRLPQLIITMTRWRRF